MFKATLSRWCALLLLSLGSRAGVSTELSAELLRQLKNASEEVRRCFNVSGLAVGVTRGEASAAFGLGWADVESQKPVTADTIFGVGSLTKAFTAALLAELMPEHGVNWSTPLKDIIPGIRMNTSLLTDHVTLIDVLTHRTGVKDYVAPLLFGYGPQVDRRELERRIRFHAPTESFRKTALYNNHFFALGGYAAEHLEGKAWEALVNETIFTPLGMRSSGFVQSWRSTANFSKMYCSDASDRNLEMPSERLEYVAPLGPSGSIYSSANDMIKWMRFNLWKLHNPRGSWSQVFVSHVPTKDSSIVTGFGIGWMQGNYSGIPFWMHTGGIEGFCSVIALFPTEGSAVFISANTCSRNFEIEPWAMAIAEKMLGLHPRADASAICRSKLAPVASSFQQEMGHEFMTPCRGTYRHPAFGDVNVTDSKSGMSWSMGFSTGRLSPVEPTQGIYKMRFEAPSQSLNYCFDNITIQFSSDCENLRMFDSHVLHVRHSNGFDRVQGEGLGLLILFLLVPRAFGLV